MKNKIMRMPDRTDRWIIIIATIIISLVIYSIYNSIYGKGKSGIAEKLVDIPLIGTELLDLKADGPFYYVYKHQYRGVLYAFTGQIKIEDFLEYYTLVDMSRRFITEDDEKLFGEFCGIEMEGIPNRKFIEDDYDMRNGDIYAIKFYEDNNDRVIHLRLFWFSEENRFAAFVYRSRTGS